MDDRLLHRLESRIEAKRAVIGVIGLGYVGLPVAATFAGAGFNVVGVDVKQERVQKINAGENPIGGDEPGLAELIETVVSKGQLVATSSYDELTKADVILIDVETPVEADHQPRYEALQAVCRDLGQVLHEGVLVVVESTVAPGTVDRLVRPLLEESYGKRSAIDFFVGACPERVMPGKLLLNLRTMDRVCGGETPEVARVMVKLYQQIVDAELDEADPVTAEVVKTTENAYRDVQIAFANEVALICEDVGADVWRVRELVNKVPMRQMHFPGAGVGGHCIPKDPWLLASAADKSKPARLIPQARAINDGMPLHVAELTVTALQSMNVELGQALVAVLGYAYLADSDDDRNSPSRLLVSRLQGLGIDVAVHDPWIGAYQGDYKAAIAGRDAVIVMVAHQEYMQLDGAELKALLRTPIVVDGRRVLDHNKVEAAGLIYRCVGRGMKPDQDTGVQE